MSYLDIALQIASKAHQGQQDKQGKPYILHLIRVMNSVEGELLKCVAVLHDTVEDSFVNQLDIEEYFPEAVARPLHLLTREKGQSYADYVVQISTDTIATEVKKADLMDNMSLCRILYRPDHATEDLLRIRKYILSYQFLNGKFDEDSYRKELAKPVGIIHDEEKA